MPLFEAVGLAKLYDIAIMSTKGMSVTASRELVDTLCSSHKIPLIVLHDFDKSGFSIVGTLKRDTRRYTFASNIEVIDAGLRLSDIAGLQREPSGIDSKSKSKARSPSTLCSGAARQGACRLDGKQGMVSGNCRPCFAGHGP